MDKRNSRTSQPLFNDPTNQQLKPAQSGYVHNSDVTNSWSPQNSSFSPSHPHRNSPNHQSSAAYISPASSSPVHYPINPDNTMQKSPAHYPSHQFSNPLKSPALCIAPAPFSSPAFSNVQALSPSLSNNSPLKIQAPYISPNKSQNGPLPTPTLAIHPPDHPNAQLSPNNPYPSLFHNSSPHATHSLSPIDQTLEIAFNQSEEPNPPTSINQFQNSQLLSSETNNPSFRPSTMRPRKQRLKKPLSDFLGGTESEMDRGMVQTDTGILKGRKKKGSKRKPGRPKKIPTPSEFNDIQASNHSTSLSDGGIIACNRIAFGRGYEWEANQIWEFGRRIGVIGKGKDMEVIAKLTQMAERDRPFKA